MQKSWKAGLLFVAPALIFYVVFLIIPYALAFGVSFMHWRGVSLNLQFSGLDNFARMVGDPNFWKAFGNTVFFTVTTGVIVPVLALYFAVSVTRRLVLAGRFFRITYFFPNLTKSFFFTVNTEVHHKNITFTFFQCI